VRSPKLLFPEFQNYSMRCGREERDTYRARVKATKTIWKQTETLELFKSFLLQQAVTTLQTNKQKRVANTYM
jgi:hypothetical protein